MLLRKNDGLFGGGKWDPPGGKMLQDETPEVCVVREVGEETGLSIEKMQDHGILRYYKEDRQLTPDWLVYHFSTGQFQGTLTESREGILRWFRLDEIPVDNMWEDYRYWYKHLLEGKKLEGDFYFSGDFEKLRDYKLKVH